MEYRERIAKVLKSHSDVLLNPSRETMIKEGIDNREGIVSANGALATWTP